MSDCHIWFGRARSKRRGACSRGPLLARASGISPASCSIERTSVSLTPSDAKRASTSLMRRVPHSGCSVRAATTASRFVSRAYVGALGGGPDGFGVSASTPPSS